MDFKELKDVINFAMEKEQEAADFYMDAGRQESFSGSKAMLKDFAQEELKHKNLLQDLLDNKVDTSVQSYQLKWITDIKRSDFIDEVEYKPGMGYRDMLMLAMKREENALKLYNEMLSNSEDENVKKLFKILCQEEAKHKLALETMYDDYMAEMGD
ncbi:Ferritin-like domain-containing protein [Desulfonema limicola]|uniref:Ferritin-like domain-containing protein n=1 Tax=Desulfonema limicola TaxID=45656 RepID=A0A975BBA7_9BACT|nr:ferritin family protein [Desulfonema limicola]QTA82143.1 Ferritin-like domain-containing protein [Desulfonema limicola]